MEDIVKKLYSYLTRQEKKNNLRHLPTDIRSAATDPNRSVVRPHISLKARMLGGQVETITRLGGSMR